MSVHFDRIHAYGDGGWEPTDDFVAEIARAQEIDEAEVRGMLGQLGVGEALDLAGEYEALA